MRSKSNNIGDRVPSRATVANDNGTNADFARLKTLDLECIRAADARRDAPPHRRFDLDRQLRALHDECYAIQRRLAAEFGARRGWRLSSTPFALSVLARRGMHGGSIDAEGWPSEFLDHAYHYRTPGRRAAGIAAHLYDTRSEHRNRIEHWAAAHGLEATFPDFGSWWFPGQTMLVLYSPRGRSQ